jgi:hypothetical protein
MNKYMKNQLSALPVVALILGVLAMAAQFLLGSGSSYVAANTYDANVKAVETSVTRTNDAAIATRHLLYKQGAGAGTVAVCGASDIALGTIDNIETETGKPQTVFLLGKGCAKKMVASGAISAGGRVYQAASGKVAATGSRLIGYAITASASDGDILVVNDSLVTPPGVTTGSTTKAGGTLAVPITHRQVVMTTGGAEALTLANGAPGQRLNLVLGTDGGDGTLTPTTKTGFATIVFADAGDIVDLEYVDDTVGWILTGSAGVAAPPVITV